MKDLAPLAGGSFKVRLFLGANQSKIPVALAAAVHALGENAEYVQLESGGSNALDFHIAYYVGVLSVQNPSAQFHIISKDTGFDPLIKHLKLRGINAQRVHSIGALQSTRLEFVLPSDDQVHQAIAHLSNLKAAKPRTARTLRSTLHALFKKQLSPEQVSALFDALRERRIVTVDGAKVTYEGSFGS